MVLNQDPVKLSIPDVFGIIIRNGKFLAGASLLAAITTMIVHSLIAQDVWKSLNYIRLQDGSAFVDFDAPAIAINSLKFTDSAATVRVVRTADRNFYTLILSSLNQLPKSEISRIFTEFVGRVNTSGINTRERVWTQLDCTKPIFIDPFFLEFRGSYFVPSDTRRSSALGAIYGLLVAALLLQFKRKNLRL